MTDPSYLQIWIERISLWLPRLFWGTLTTIEIAVFGMFLAMILGLIAAGMKLSGRRILSIPAEIYTTVIRGIPDLVLILLIYNLVQWASNQTGLWLRANYREWGLGWTPRDFLIEPYPAIIIALGVIFGAYLCEGFRGAFLAIPKGQFEAADAYGIGKRRRFMRIIWPQLVRNALASISNIWQVVIKAAALAYLIGAVSPLTGEKDLLKISFEAANDFIRTDSFALMIMFLFAGAIFLGITAASQLFFAWVERWSNKGFHR